MVITDSRVADPVRPVFLTFDGEVEPGEPFAHMVESGALAAALIEACRAARRRSAPAASGLRGRATRRCRCRARRRRQLEAHLLVAADGARSRLREEAGIGWVGWSYPQSGDRRDDRA